MTVHAFQPASPLAGDGVALAHALQRGGVRKESLVCVTGPAALTAMLWLARRGFQRAVLAAAGSARLGEPADVLLIPHACSSEQLRSLLSKGARLGARGVLIVQIAGGQADGGPDDPAATLVSLGFELRCKLADRGRTVLIAHRAGSDDFRKAA
jgi:hypothetical protein